MHVYSLGVSILKDYWNQGIGTKFFEMTIEHIKNIGGRKITLQVQVRNERAVKLYQKFGFKIIGTLKKQIKVNDEYFDEFAMELIL